MQRRNRFSDIWRLVFDWNDLVYFLELARQSRLAPAARRLKVDHTTVSRRIAELEKSLSVKLFDRKPDGFVLTEHGHRLFAIAERIEQEAFSVPQTLGSDTTTATGRVRVATMEGIGAFFLAERFAELAERNAGILVELVTERHLISLTKREADIFLSFVHPWVNNSSSKKWVHSASLSTRVRSICRVAGCPPARPIWRRIRLSITLRISLPSSPFTGSWMCWSRPTSRSVPPACTAAERGRRRGRHRSLAVIFRQG